MKHVFKGISGTQVFETAPRTPLPIVRCPHCNKRLFDGFMVGEIMCPRGSCKRLVKFLAEKDRAAYSETNGTVSD